MARESGEMPSSGLGWCNAVSSREATFSTDVTWHIHTIGLDSLYSKALDCTITNFTDLDWNFLNDLLEKYEK